MPRYNFYAVIVLMLLILVLGSVTFRPCRGHSAHVQGPAVQVMTFTRACRPAPRSRMITDRIERWTNQSPGVQQVESRSLAGVSVVRLYFRDDTDPTAALTMTNSAGTFHSSVATTKHAAACCHPVRPNRHASARNHGEQRRPGRGGGQGRGRIPVRNARSFAERCAVVTGKDRG